MRALTRFAMRTGEKASAFSFAVFDFFWHREANTTLQSYCWFSLQSWFAHLEDCWLSHLWENTNNMLYFYLTLQIVWYLDNYWMQCVTVEGQCQVQVEQRKRKCWPIIASLASFVWVLLFKTRYYNSEIGEGVDIVYQDRKILDVDRSSFGYWLGM